MTFTERCVGQGQRIGHGFLLFVFGLLIAGIANGQLHPQILFQMRSSGSYLGLRLTDLDADRARELKLKEVSGVEIVAVQEGAAAYQAGLRVGDVLLTYNGEKVLGVQQFVRLVSETPPDRRVAIGYWRGGSEKQVVVTTGSPRTVATYDFITTMRVTDVPSPMMLWRNVVLGFESAALGEQLEQTLGVKQGILIWNVDENSPAQHAGLRAGDVLTGFCGHAIHSPREVGFVLQQLQTAVKPVSNNSQPGGSKSGSMNVNVLRDHKTVSLSISLDGDEH
jgi:serine protease Do